MFSPSVWQTASLALHKSMALPPHTGLTVSGRPNLADGLPNTAMAATWSGALGGSGLLNPTAGTGTALMTSITAAPFAYPPNTSLVSGQLLTMYWMWALASLAPPAAARKSKLAGELTAYVPTDLPPTLPRSASTNASPTFPRPGASLVPRAKTTSMAGQSSADAIARSPIGMGDTAGRRTAAEAVRAAVAEAMNQRRNRLNGTTNDSSGYRHTRPATKLAACCVRPALT